MDLSPDAVFDRDYALTVVARAFARLREEAAASGKADLFAAASEFLLESPDASEYGELALRLGLRRNTLAVAIHRLRSRLRDLIRNELSLTVDDAGALHAEMSALHKALAPNRTASGGSAAP